MVLQDGDILLASTGEGTIGKCCVYRNYDDQEQTRPGIPEGHVTVIRVDSKKVYPEYLCDYLRKGFGHDQLYRSLTGTTGMVEATPRGRGRDLGPGPPEPGGTEAHQRPPPQERAGRRRSRRSGHRHPSRRRNCLPRKYAPVRHAGYLDAGGSL